MNGLSINHYICPPDMTVPAFLDAAVAAGAAAVGVTARAVAEAGAETLKAMPGEHGLAVSSVNSAGYFANKDGALVDDHDRRTVEAAAILDAGALCVISGGRGALCRGGAGAGPRRARGVRRNRASGREFLSRGLVDLAGLIARFEADGYAGFYEFEIFPPDLRGRPVEDALQDAARFMRERAAVS